MPVIQFDVLVPDAAAGEVEGAFARALDILVSRGMLDSASVSHESHPLLDAHTHAQLKGVYEADRGEDPDEAGAQPHRFSISAAGASSYNQLAMGLSRILTPKAQLPRDPAALEQEQRFEQPSIYPWVVEILR
ncbi:MULTISPECIES: hypothetical protein [Corynebacterium]|uniref:Uncharacterized protein n=1 Tax=Corynebacterium sanguinis TaxID=2594913 RepID=A0A838X002_9CORY|nr:MULTISPECIES: hypothetical protein [Corynebacterium]MBA4506293.1 hypothetical protein [Corynebacterium sanguinis]MCT1424799.1 hypothetical protein [Corynebacterium sanguinis]MCT1694963.1 hypothetical protein [Corynebacterium sanguinis]MCT1714547.1 hypothetical protein [Corynebacterium sanguinis]MCT1804577.1 hypothetical protein [Corynebacterium sanguinis]